MVYIFNIFHLLCKSAVNININWRGVLSIFCNQEVAPFLAEDNESSAWHFLWSRNFLIKTFLAENTTAVSTVIDLERLFIRKLFISPANCPIHLFLRHNSFLEPKLLRACLVFWIPCPKTSKLKNEIEICWKNPKFKKMTKSWPL